MEYTLERERTLLYPIPNYSPKPQCFDIYKVALNLSLPGCQSSTNSLSMGSRSLKRPHPNAIKWVGLI